MSPAVRKPWRAVYLRIIARNAQGEGIEFALVPNGEHVKYAEADLVLVLWPND